MKRAPLPPLTTKHWGILGAWLVVLSVLQLPIVWIGTVDYMVAPPFLVVLSQFLAIDLAVIFVVWLFMRFAIDREPWRTRLAVLGPLVLASLAFLLSIWFEWP